MSLYRSCGLIQEQGAEEAAAAWDVAVGATLACDGAPPTLGDVALADGAAATHWPRTPRTCPERRTSGPDVTHLARRAMYPRRLGAWYCATARSDGWFRLSAVWAHWPTFYKKWARGR